MADMMAPDLIGQFSSNLVHDKVDVIEFAESEDYCDIPLYPRQRTLLKAIFLQELNDYDIKVLKEWQAPGGEVTMGPRLFDRMDFLRENQYPHFRLVQFVGGRRASKGLVTAIALAYKLYQVTQLDSPHRYFNIARGKAIEFAIVASSLEQAKAHQFDDAFNTLIECKPLLDQNLIGRAIAESISVNTPYDLRRASNMKTAGGRVDKDTASLRVKAHGTNSKTIRGAATLFFVFDEMAHLIGGESRMSDKELFKAVEPSLRQFGKNSLTFTNSSPYTKTGKFYELYEQGMQDGDDKPLLHDHFMIQFPSWELYKDWKQDEKMTVLMGDHGEPPSQSPDVSPLMAQDELIDPETFKVEHRAQFAEVIDAFLNPDMVDRMFDPEFARQTIGAPVIPNSTGAVHGFRYKGHGDPSSTTANFGIAIAHTVEVENKDTGISESHVVFDLINAFFPEDFEEHTIDWLEVVPEISTLINNFRPYEFTFDQFDSTMAIQVLQREVTNYGAETNVFEKTATHKVNEMRAHNFRAALNLGRVHAAHPTMYNANAVHNPIELGKQELKFLQVKNGKVDKQTIGPIQTKDISDCIMECVDALIGDSIAMINHPGNTHLETGAHGGYFIGKHRTSEGTPFEEFYHRGASAGGTPRDPARGISRRGR